MKRLVQSVVSACMVLMLMPVAGAATTAQIDAARNKALGWILQAQKGDGNWKNAAGTEVLATTAALDALNRAGLKGGYPYAAGVAWLGNATALSNDSLARQVITLYQAGVDVSALTTRLIAQRNDANRNWGALDEYEGSFPDTALAMDAIKITGTVYADAGYGIGFITSKQNTNGGWSYTKTEPVTPQSLVIPTAYNLLTLNRYKATYAVQTYINTGIAWLKTQQKAGGGFGEGPAGTLHETALAYRALVAELGAADPAAVAAQDFLITQQATDGSWAGNSPLTALLLGTLPAPAIALADTDKDGIPDSVELVLNTNATVADSRWLARGNGQSVVGVTVPKLVLSAVIGKPYNQALTVSGGTAPYTWTIISGKLPAGLALNSGSGTVSGTPTTLGAASFEYTAKDASGQTLRVAAQLTVVDVPDSAEIPTLSEWGMILMGLLLLASMIYMDKKRARRGW